MTEFRYLEKLVFNFFEKNNKKPSEVEIFEKLMTYKRAKKFTKGDMILTVTAVYEKLNGRFEADVYSAKEYAYIHEKTDEKYCENCELYKKVNEYFEKDEPKEQEVESETIEEEVEIE